ncbi:MAG: hypothetical protein M1826_001080 [Phylliscum demangeonii]|nr:MAG: hypothetical protein M1826_001080 [Phylliscum demangeonii]
MKRVQRRTAAKEPAPGPAPGRLFRDNEYEDSDGLLTGEPTMQEMERVLSKAAYDQYVADWDRGKAYLRMEYAISRGYVMSAEEAAQHAADHQSLLAARKVQYRVTRILLRSKQARPEMVAGEQARVRRDSAMRRERRRQRSGEIQTLTPLVQQEGTATDDQLKRYQALKKARSTEYQKAQAREAKAIQEAEARMATLKPLIRAKNATEAQRRKYEQLETFVKGKRATRAAENKRYREKKKREKAEREAAASGQAAPSPQPPPPAPDGSGPDMKKEDHPLQMATQSPLGHPVERSWRQAFRRLGHAERHTLTWLRTVRSLSPEAAPPRPVLAFPE